MTPPGTVLGAHWDTEQLMDLVFTVGQYTLVSMALRTFEVPSTTSSSRDPACVVGRAGDDMDLILGLPTDHVDAREEFGTVEAVAEMAATAERLGYAGVFVTDHPPPADFIASGGHHTLDPMVVLAVAGAERRLRLMTNLFIVAYRNPFLAAKAVATLDSMTGGSVIMGTGAGYLEGEFVALGVDFDHRNDVLDDHLAVMRRVWTGSRCTPTAPATAPRASSGCRHRSSATAPPLHRSGWGATVVERCVGSRVSATAGCRSPRPRAWPTSSARRRSRRSTISQPASRCSTVSGRKPGEPATRSSRSNPGTRAATAPIASRPPATGSAWPSSSDLGVGCAPVMLSSIGRGIDLDRAGFLERAAGFIDEVG